MIRRDRPAMATWFQVWLGGPDPDHLVAVADAALDEVARVERLLSRFDPAAELARVNREATARPVRASPGLLAVLHDCRRWWAATEGYFDPCHGGPAPFGEVVEIDDAAGTIRLHHPRARIDLGGFAKGYALDRAIRVIDEFGVASAFLHGGTSSALARGVGPDGRPWRVALRDPFADDPRAELGRVDLADRGFSSSALLGPGMVRSDIVDPTTGLPKGGQAAVSAIAPTAAEAEVLSTALLAMGAERMRRWLGQTERAGVRVARIDRHGVEWV